MTEIEQETLAKTQTEIKAETKKIGDSMTRILLLGGPQYVESLLGALTKANESIKGQLKMNISTEFSK